jgi:hypothetical protein
MTQKPPGIGRHFILIHIEPHQTVGRVTMWLFEKVLVVSEECNALEPVEQRNDYVVGGPCRRNVPAYLAYTESPLLQKNALVIREVLIQQVHAALA